MAPTVEYEHALLAKGHTRIAGLDEAGRGCWAGPVVAAAVVLGADVLQRPELLVGVDDSKKLGPSERASLYDRIQAMSQAIGVGIVPAYLIDALGILPATRLAMIIALLKLPRLPDALLIDAVSLPELRLPQEALVKGDSRSLAIAAASIVAKVTRDRMMYTADLAYPAYGFAAHKGYGTAAHRRALAIHGPCPLHRRSFAPVMHFDTEAKHAR